MSPPEIRQILRTTAAYDEFGFSINPGEDVDFSSLAAIEAYIKDSQECLAESIAAAQKRQGGYAEEQIGYVLLRNLANKTRYLAFA